MYLSGLVDFARNYCRLLPSVDVCQTLASIWHLLSSESNKTSFKSHIVGVVSKMWPLQIKQFWPVLNTLWEGTLPGHSGASAHISLETWKLLCYSSWAYWLMGYWDALQPPCNRRPNSRHLLQTSQHLGAGFIVQSGANGVSPVENCTPGPCLLSSGAGLFQCLLTNWWREACYQGNTFFLTHKQLGYLMFFSQK